MSTSNLRLLYLKFPMGTPRTMLLKNGGHTACQRSYIDLMFGANDGQAAINLSHFCIYICSHTNLAILMPILKKINKSGHSLTIPTFLHFIKITNNYYYTGLGIFLCLYVGKILKDIPFKKGAKKVSITFLKSNYKYKILT